ncbi:hypothetical protein [Aerobium aerolatum]|uniref:Uncharacterized protein n=1 Tax=Aquamicrobium aerolatum DSM 21857 TaxID=1121003 RepID=A0A1I3T7X2_9HYPH|nr:hypothetical protein [Aquamicrobium aerolatum]SFJ65597.1 hypothetical protein SAMN03080618_03566 [Aquamicrobium aerolatum DSM 21857]
MSTALSLRLKRLEKKAGLEDPLKLLTDEELDRMIDTVEASIATTAGVPAHKDAERLHGREAADELTQAEMQRLVISIVNTRHEIGASHGR